jgi:hypothetical protein
MGFAAAFAACVRPPLNIALDDAADKPLEH